MRRADVVSLLADDSDMVDPRFAVAASIRTPEDKVAGLGFGACDMLAFGTIVLLLRRVRETFLGALVHAVAG